MPTRSFVKWNEYKGPFTSVSAGGGLLYDFAAYEQDKESQEQVGDLPMQGKLRDARVLFKGRFGTQRKITWTMGIMYDDPSHSWLYRETGIMVAVPEIDSNFFVGRTKEGFSLNKVMVGYAGWTMERAGFSDATIPILADGGKWLGYVPQYHVLWNLGAYTDAVTARQSFELYSHQFVGRVAWLPILPESGSSLLHIGVNGLYGKVSDGQLQLKNRPEAFPAPFFVNTTKFPADHVTMAGLEAYYRPGPWLFGTEYWIQNVSSPQTGNPIFHGGDVVATYMLTGETRGYNTVGGFFKEIRPANSVFKGGVGAWELVLRQSYEDLDEGTLRGGTFWRLTPMVNWYADDHLRLEAAYGYGILDRLGLRGATHFFQLRAQLWIF